MPERSTTRTGLLLFVFFSCLYLLTMRLAPTGGDDRTMLTVAVTLVEQHRITFPAEMNLTGGVRGRGFQVYSKYPIGQSLAEIPFYLAGKAAGSLIVAGEPGLERERDRGALATQFAVLLPVLLSAGTCVLLFQLCVLLGCGQRASMLTALAFGVGTTVWPYSGSLLSEPLQAFLLLAAVYLACRYVARVSYGSLALSGVAFGYLITVRPNLVILLPILWLYAVLAPKGRWRDRLALSGLLLPGVLAGVAVTLGYNWLRFGQLFEFGYGDESFNTPLYVGLWGLLLSPGRSLLLYSPVLLLSIIGGVAFWRKHRAEAAMLLSASAALTLFYAKWHVWSGAHCWGPRFLAPIVPLLMVPAAAAFEQLLTSRCQWKRVALVALLIVAVLVQIPGVAIDPLLYFHIVFSVASQPVVHALLGDNIDFTPHFCPLAGNTWLLKWSIIRMLSDGPVTLDQVLDDAPWSGIRPGWRPEFPVTYLRPQQWYVKYEQTAPGVGLGGAIAYLCAVGAGAAGSGVLLARAYRRLRRAETGQCQTGAG